MIHIIIGVEALVCWCVGVVLVCKCVSSPAGTLREAASADTTAGSVSL